MDPTRQLINSSGNHTVQICITPHSQADLVIRYIKEGVRNREAIFVISKPALRKILKLKMDGLSFDGQPLQDPNQIRFFDAAFLLSYLKSDEGLEERAFQEHVATPVNEAQSQYRKVRAFEEIVDILWKQNQHDMLIQHAGYVRNLIRIRNLSLLCTYCLDELDPDAYEEALECICKCHSHLTPQKANGSLGQETTEERLNPFKVAWDRVINKLAS